VAGVYDAGRRNVTGLLRARNSNCSGAPHQVTAWGEAPEALPY